VSSFKIEARGGQYSIEFESSDLAGLDMAPDRLEPALARGRWLVLVFAVWSSPDRQAIEQLVADRAELPSDLRVGVRPFDSHDELQSWCPAATEKFGSPIWLLLEDGQLIAERTGWVGSGELSRWIADAG
jgi:hypothetical protein